MFDPRRMLRWFGKILIVLSPVMLVLERCATWCLDAAFRFRGATAPKNTNKWALVMHNAIQRLLDRQLQEPPSRLMEISDMVPAWLGPTIVKTMLILPSLLMVLMAVSILGWFVKSLYGLPDIQQGSSFVLRSAFGKRGFSPFLIFRKGGEEVAGSDEETLRNIGGPGSVLLERDTAVLLEKAGKFTRVKLPPCVIELKRFERVYATIDLRPRVWPFTVSAMSKEGIPVKCKVNVHFQIDPSGGEQAVFKAATCTWVRGEHWLEDKLDWAGRVIISNTEGTLRAILARTPLDQLVPAQVSHPEAGTREEIPKRVIRGRIENELRSALESSAPNLSAVILDVCLGDIQVAEEIKDQWANIWRTGWRSWATEVVNEGKTSYREKIEDARIEGQVALLEVLGHTLRDLKRANVPITNELITLHFMDVIENIQRLPDGWMQSYLPPPLMQALEQIKHL